MATMTDDEERKLREQRAALEAIKEAHASPLPADPSRFKVRPSDRVDPAERLAFLQEHRDELLRENVMLRRIVHALLDQTDARRRNGRQGGRARSASKVERDELWVATAIEIRRHHPSFNISDLARTVRRKLACTESVKTISDVLRQKVGR
ncbi:MAG: hypothetical protein ACTHNM_06790 [Dyella sp.]|uniref:hypothetical protein n=1 Tax=Dyella sp. TaxID=1869338 RepID=UPI003F80BA29